MPHGPIAGASARDAMLRPTVGGRRAPVTARGRQVLDKSRRRLQDGGTQLDAALVARSVG
jgi:hypothetical protein